VFHDVSTHTAATGAPITDECLAFFDCTLADTELLREISGSGIVMQPSENDLANPELRPSLERFMRGKDVDVEYKSRPFRIAHELAMSSFGMRQDVYEYWHAGDPSRNRINLLRACDQSDITQRIKDLCSRPLARGTVP